jgi:hypothetical protein
VRKTDIQAQRFAYAMEPTSASGQKRKTSIPAHVFRCSSNSGHSCERPLRANSSRPANDNGTFLADGVVACDKLTRRAKFRLTRRANHFYKFARLTRQEGRIAIVTKRGMGCGGRDSIVRAMGWQGGLFGP